MAIVRSARPFLPPRYFLTPCSTLQHPCEATWGGSPIQAPDGTFHLFFSWIKMEDNTTSPSIQVRWGSRV